MNVLGLLVVFVSTIKKDAVIIAALAIHFLASSVVEAESLVPVAADVGRQEAILLARASSTSEYDQLKRFLGAAPRGRKGLIGKDRYAEHRRVGRLLKDPAIAQNFHQIRDEWFRGSTTEWNGYDPLFADFPELIQVKVMISRNLFFDGLQVSAVTVRREYERIQRAREQYRDLTLFAGRKILYTASNDRIAKGKFLFGRDPMRRWLKKTAAELIFLREGEQAATGRRLDGAIASAERLTFLFEGHGRPLALKFSRKLSPKMLAASIAARSPVGTEASPVIVILDACQSHIFGRKVLRILRQTHPNTPLPVVITPEEYGQDFVRSIYGDRFLKQDLRVPYRSGNRLGALIKGFTLVTSLYVPDENNRVIQIG